MGGVAHLFERFSTLTFFAGQESEEAEGIGGQTAGDERAEKCGRSGDWNDRDVMADGEGHQAEAGVGDAGHTGIGDESDALALFEMHDEFCRLGELIVLVVAGRVGLDAVMVEELLRLPGILASDEIDFFQRPNGAIGDVLEVTDGRTDEVKANAGGGLRHESAGYIVGCEV